MFSRKSPVFGRKVCISSDSALASQVGIDVLKNGGNAADAAVGMAAVLGVVKPMLCGIGGDAMCLFYKASDKSVRSINGSGRSSADMSLEKVNKCGFVQEPIEDATNGLWINVPGAVAGMFDCVRHFGSGKLSMMDLFTPAIKLAKEGYPVASDTASCWREQSSILKSTRHGKDLMKHAASLQEGDILQMEKLADCLKTIAKEGMESFYKGPIAQHIVNEVQYSGGCLTLADMSNHYETCLKTAPQQPMYVDIHGYRLWEMGPNTIGIIALYVLKILEGFDLKAHGHNSPEYIHIVAEAIKIGIVECWDHLCDPDFAPFPKEELFSLDHISKKRSCVRHDRVLKLNESKTYSLGGNTSYLAAVDKDGNSCSFIFSVSSHFGSGQVPQDCEFVLHDRGKCFSLNKESPNVIGPSKRSLHSILPAIITDPKSNELIATFGVIGRWMQPQGHIQVFLNMVIFGMDPQKALDAPRFFVGNFDTYMEYRDYLNELCLEEGITTKVAADLRDKGHTVKADLPSNGFGVGHIIAKPVLWKTKDCLSESDHSWWAASDPRVDGLALGY